MAKKKLGRCTVENCDNPAIARGLCNAHYIRNKTNKSLLPRIRPLRDPICTIENCNNPHEGLGFCKKHLKKHQRQQRWLILIELKGGKCQKCGNSYHFSVYDFHHRDPIQKEFEISQQIVNISIEDLLPEVEKCDLLCSNCHRELHYKEE